MPMLSPELKNMVLRYLSHSISLADFEDWLVPQLHRFLEPPTCPDADVTAAAYHGLIEVGDGIRTEDQFRVYLKGALRQAEVGPSLVEKPAITETSSSNSTVLKPVDVSVTSPVLTVQIL